jgi:hypothetical protein
MADIAGWTAKSPFCAMCGRLRAVKDLIDTALLVGAAMCPACLRGTVHGRWP